MSLRSGGGRIDWSKLVDLTGIEPVTSEFVIDAITFAHSPPGRREEVHGPSGEVPAAVTDVRTQSLSAGKQRDKWQPFECAQRGAVRVSCAAG